LKVQQRRPNEEGAEPVHVQRVIYTTDFSDASAAALPAALEITRRFDAELHILHVAERLLDVMPVTGGLEEDAHRDFDRNAHERLDRWVAERVPADLKATSVMREGDPATEIVALAREQNADLIVMGLHGHSAVERWLVGSVTEAVLHKTPCPVLGVPGHAG
jgi:nucleotide-binding universal stress UspA family protein